MIAKMGILSMVLVVGIATAANRPRICPDNLKVSLEDIEKVQSKDFRAPWSGGAATNIKQSDTPEVVLFDQFEVNLKFERLRSSGKCQYEVDVKKNNKASYQVYRLSDGKVVKKSTELKIGKDSLYAIIGGDVNNATMTLLTEEGFEGNKNSTGYFAEWGYKFRKQNIKLSESGELKAKGYSFRHEHRVVGIYEKTGTHEFKVTVPDYVPEKGFVNVNCTLEDRPEYKSHFEGLGYRITSISITQTAKKKAWLTVNRGPVNPAHEILLLPLQLLTARGDGFKHKKGSLKASWDWGEFWADLSRDGEKYKGVIAIEQDFAFRVSCSSEGK